MRADEFLNMVKDDNEKVNFKLGVVADLFSNGTAKITFDGETEVSTKQYSYLSSYRPKKGDRVLLAKVGGTYVILGNLMFKEILQDTIQETTVETKDNTDLEQIREELSYKISSDMTDDNGGNMNINYMYVDPSTGELRVRRKNGSWTFYKASDWM